MTFVLSSGKCWFYTKLFTVEHSWTTEESFLVNEQRDAQFFSMYLFLFLTHYVFRAQRAHHQERQIVSIQPLVTVTLCQWPCSVQVGSELIYQESLHDARPTKCKTLREIFIRFPIAD
jgi:hypothetical protein